MVIPITYYRQKRLLMSKYSMFHAREIPYKILIGIKDISTGNVDDNDIALAEVVCEIYHGEQAFIGNQEATGGICFVHQHVKAFKKPGIFCPWSGYYHI